MADGMKLEGLGGFDKLAESLSNLGQRMSDQAAKRAVRAGGRIIQEAMIEQTPVLVERNAGSNALPPGTVKSMIRVRFPAKEQLLETTALIGPIENAARIAHLVEYGHRVVTGGKSRLTEFGTFKGSGKVHEEDVPAHPFLRPAYEASEQAAYDVVAETLGKELQHPGNEEER